MQYGMSERADGVMKLFTGDAARDAKFAENRWNYFTKVGVDPARVVAARLDHGKVVRCVRVPEVPVTPAPQGTVSDALITSEPGLTLAVTISDCVPVYFWDKEHGAVGIAHAGWRGVVANIAAEVVQAMVAQFRTDPAALWVQIGPAIQKCHFLVQDDIIAQFDPYLDAIRKTPEGFLVDLPTIVAAQLQMVGVKNMQNSGLCTYCLPERFTSYRRDKPEFPEAMIAYIVR